MKFVHKWTDPAVLDALLNYWTVHGTVVNVCITGTKINKDMMISQYVSTIKSLKDYYYTIRFIDYEKISVSSSKRKRKTTKVKKKKEDKYLSATKLAEVTGISRRNVENNIKKLKDMGVLVRQGSPKYGYWIITKR